MFNNYTKTVFTEQEEMDIKIGDPVLESFFVDDIAQLNEAERKELMASEEFKTLVEMGYISEASVMYLDKEDDLSRRIAVAAAQLEKEAGGALYAELEKAIAKKKAIMAKIAKKNRAAAIKYAKAAQKQYIKATPGAFKKRISIVGVDNKE